MVYKWFLLSLAFNFGLCFSGFYPTISTPDQFAEQRIFNVSDVNNFLVLNKTNIAVNTGLALFTAFLIGTAAYSIEENSVSSKIDDVLDGIFVNIEDTTNEILQEQVESAKAKKVKKARKQCDCETYCTNKYYYGDGNYDASTIEYSSRYDAKTQQTRRKRG